MVYKKMQTVIDDLYNVPENGKAEIVDGVLILGEPAGAMHGRASLKIAVSLSQMERKLDGLAYSDNVGFIVNLPNRQSFSPDAAFHTGKNTGMKFLEGAPIFAVEVRSEGDCGRTAEKEMARKRNDYFAAGTMVVWDVDLLGDEVVRVYRASNPEDPTIYRRGEIAEAEPAVPGWRMPVDELFS
jgi:Uma2 family endonuclease